MAEFPRTLRHGSGVTLTQEPDVAVTALRPPSTGRAAAADDAGRTAADADDALRRAGLEPITSPGRPTAGARGAGRSPGGRINADERIRWVRLDRQDGTPAAAQRTEEVLGGRLEWLVPAYRVPGVDGPEGLVCALPDTLLLRPADGTGDAQLDELAGRLGLDLDAGRTAYTAPFRVYRVRDPKARNAYELREELEGEAVVADVRLETMTMLVPTSLHPDDPLYARQWGVQRIGAPAAWDLTTGDPGTVIAVIDEGCDLGHPDLRFSGRGVNLGSMRPGGGPTGDHGTPCAGIAAATVQNGTGVSGVAGDARVLPIAFQYWTDVECAAGIRYAVAHGARVVSMSFGVYGPEDGLGPAGWDFALIDPALAHAAAKDVVLCAATGNEDHDGHNRYPARHAAVIACGASDQADNRKSPSSPDGEWWGSTHAPGVSVVAPGVLITTTDRRGNAGYHRVSGADGDYVPDFNGTSAATPHVAGVAALLRSRYPGLSAVTVRALVEASAARVGHVRYAERTGFPHGPRNDEMGYGRVDAHAALRLADIVLAQDPPGVLGTTDVDGDGLPALVGFSDRWVQVARNTGGAFATPRKVVEHFGRGSGWRVERHPRFLADLTGDGLPDVVGFGDDGVWVSRNTGTGTFATPRLV